MPITPVEPVLIAGAGLSGSVIARELAEAGLNVRIFEARNHIAGNCHTARDPETGVMVHHYGPHIFHTGNGAVWSYVNRFAKMQPYRHSVRTTVGGRTYSLPVNLTTINQFFGTNLTPKEAEAFVKARADQSIRDPESFEDQALAMMGPELYKAFFKGYTQKQWGCDPRQLPTSILKRLPLRFTADDSYFNHPHQGLPDGGYTAMVAAILDHPGITVHLNTPLDPANPPGRGHLIWSGPLDAYFGHRLGRLGYRTLKFEHHRTWGDFQGIPVMNYGDADVPQTRITEHKHFTPWECHARTIYTCETSHAAGAGDIPYYPIRLVEEKALLAGYVAKAGAETGVTFVGRLGTYRYLDMDVCIAEAFDVAAAILAAHKGGTAPPAFVHPPLG
ncbi:MAG: UDP-galactopyranose mutase [Rhodobacteraceae bacterium]|nr:UDP-galactopyranose mutase [Paracoccaceae bacterium]